MTINTLQLDGLTNAVRQANEMAEQHLRQWAATPTLRAAMLNLLRTREPELAVQAVPLLVHAAETESIREAVPVAATHHLWWLAAHVVDDVIDGGDLTYGGRITSGEAVMAAVTCGSALPVEILSTNYPPELALELLRQFLDSWVFSNDGQLMDLVRFHDLDAEDDICERVLKTYYHKNGAAYGMACSMAATVAGASPDRVNLWRLWGFSSATLGQFRNDQEDIVTGRDEDIRNSTPTYLLATYFTNLQSHQERDRASRLIAHARTSRAAASELLSKLMAADNLNSYFATVARLRDESLALLERLNVPTRIVADLRRFVYEAAEPIDGFPISDRGARGASSAPR